MQIRENENPDRDNFKYSNISISKLEIKNNWSPSLEKELIAEVKLSIKKIDKSEHKYLCLTIGVVSLLTIGLCVQANSIAQCLREMAILSVKEIISINNQELIK